MWIHESQLEYTSSEICVLKSTQSLAHTGYHRGIPTELPFKAFIYTEEKRIESKTV